jgi:ACT domain-containing protein
MEDINKKLYAKAVDIGISKDEYYHKYKFDIFNIKDMEYEKKHNAKGH